MKRLSLEQRALEAVRRLASARADIYRLTKGIGQALARCEKCPQVSMGEDEAQERDEQGRSKTCIWQSQQPVIGSAGPDWPSYDEARDILEADGCEHCKAAARMIDERRAARKRRGSVLGWIAKIGKGAQAGGVA